MELWIILKDIVVLLGACLLAGGLFSRFRQSPIIGYLMAGMLLGGPGSLHAVKSQHEIEAISELGVALLMFTLGLEFSIARLRKLGSKPILGGIAQVLLTLGLGFAGATCIFGLPIRESIAVGAMIALSSTAVVLRILMERSEMEMPHGNNSLGVLLTQDMAVIPLALLMTVLGGQGPAEAVVWNITKLVVAAAGLILGLYLLNTIAVLALGTLTLHRNRELTVIFAVVTGLGAAWASHAIGLSPAMGAFIAGMFLGSSAFATQIRADVSPLQVVLLTLFFGAAGMVADPVWIARNIPLVASVVAIITLGKLAVIWSIFAAFGQATRVAVATGLCLAQIGEFAFVLGSIGRASSVVSEATYAVVVSSAIVSFFLSAFLVPRAPKLGNLIAAWLRSPSEDVSRSEPRLEPPDVTIIGFGPAAQVASKYLIDKKLRVTVIELNPSGIRKAQELGFHGELGDATSHDVLEHSRIAECKIVLITIPHLKSALAVLNHIRIKAPNVQTIVRARYAAYQDDFTIAGADMISGDEQQVGESLAGQLVTCLKMSNLVNQNKP